MRARPHLSIIVGLSCCWLLAVQASMGVADPLRGLVQRTRTQFNRLELMAVDLVDELVYVWGRSLPVRPQSRVYLAGVAPPLGVRAAFTEFVENHFYGLVTSQLPGDIAWVHCPGCSTLSVFSHQQRTVMGPRHLVEPNAGDQIAQYADYLCYLDFAVEGSELVLRARILDPQDHHRIVFAKTLASHSSKPPLLRQHHRLASAQEARQSYMNVLSEKPNYQLPIRLLTKIFPAPSQSGPAMPASPAMLWLEVGAEFYLSPARRWFAGFYGGVASMPEAYDGFALGGRFGFLALRPFHSLVEPNLYGYMAVAYQELVGPGAELFIYKERRRIDQIRADITETKITPKVSLPAIRIGMELKAKNSFTAGVFLEGFPSEDKNENLGKVASAFHAYGFEFGVTL